VESIANAGTRDSFGIVQFSGKPSEKRKSWKASMKELESRRQKSVFLLFSYQPGSYDEEKGDSHGVAWCLMDGYDAFVDDRHSCDRP